jgi:hypothetical protein
MPTTEWHLVTSALLDPFGSLKFVLAAIVYGRLSSAWSQEMVHRIRILWGVRTACARGARLFAQLNLTAIHGVMAMTRRGLPEPPAIFSGAAMTIAPVGGSWSRLDRLANPNLPLPCM